MTSKIKIFSLIICFLFIFGLSSSSVNAALVVVRPDGQIITNVLASETAAGLTESLEIKSVAAQDVPGEEDIISLVREEGKLQLQVMSGNRQTITDVTDYNDDLIEVEERQKAKTVKIAKDGENFRIKQENISALTNFPITIDAKNKHLSVQTPSGMRYLKMLPFEIFDNTLRADIIDTLTGSDGVIHLTEDGNGELRYEITGEKNLNLFNLVKLNAPVEVSISATTGEVLQIDKPNWYRVLGFLFS